MKIAEAEGNAALLKYGILTVKKVKIMNNKTSILKKAVDYAKKNPDQTKKAINLVTKALKNKKR
ncbi:hypothetical protein [Metabacillus sp. 84]|uniref:hypothetical protein n=1 Tax=Metabacillus sp. 84 TaxID=3404705 RepID=UPI003CE9F523